MFPTDQGEAALASFKPVLHVQLSPACDVPDPFPVRKRHATPAGHAAALDATAGISRHGSASASSGAVRRKAIPRQPVAWRSRRRHP